MRGAAGGRYMETDSGLMKDATELVFSPPRSQTVLWSGAKNKLLANEFCRTFRNCQTLEMYLEAHYPAFYQELFELSARSWARAEEIWFYLSTRLAESASGDVRVFAAGVARPETNPGGKVDITKYKNKYKSRAGTAAYCNSVFEKCEGPALDTNQKVERIFLMGRNINARVSEW
jgi:hypothetical protein